MNELADMGAYFEERALLAGLHSTFACDPDCSRPGCKSREMQIAVTIFDVMGAAWHERRGVEAVYREHYHLGLVPWEGQEWILRVALKMNKPCPFLRGQWCAVYKVRPLSCILFPELFAIDGSLEDRRGRRHFKSYHCMQKTVEVPRERTTVLKRLKASLSQELLLSDHYLFGHAPLVFETAGLHRALWGPSDRSTGFCHGGSRPIDNALSMEELDRAFFQTVKTHQPFASLDEKIAELKEPEQVRSLFRALNNRDFAKRLFAHRETAIVFRFESGVLRRSRKNLTPRETCFL